MFAVTWVLWSNQRNTKFTITPESKETQHVQKPIFLQLCLQPSAACLSTPAVCLQVAPIISRSFAVLPHLPTCRACASRSLKPHSLPHHLGAGGLLSCSQRVCSRCAAWAQMLPSLKQLSRCLQSCFILAVYWFRVLFVPRHQACVCCVPHRVQPCGQCP